MEQTERLNRLRDITNECGISLDNVYFCNMADELRDMGKSQNHYINSDQAIKYLPFKQTNSMPISRNNWDFRILNILPNITHDISGYLTGDHVMNLVNGGKTTIIHSAYTMLKENYVLIIKTITNYLFIDKNLVVSIYDSDNEDIISLFEERFTLILKKTKADMDESTQVINSLISGDRTEFLVTAIKHYMVNNPKNNSVSDLKPYFYNIYSILFAGEFNSRNTAVMATKILLENKMFESILKPMIISRDEDIRQAFSRGVYHMQEIENCLFDGGYRVENDKYVKDVNIVPNKCVCWRDDNSDNSSDPPEYYDISSVEHPFIITKLKIRKDFITNSNNISVDANGRHPNVSSEGGVCLGNEMCINYTKIIKESSDLIDLGALSNYLADLDELLFLINYTSAYFSISDELREGRVPIEFEVNHSTPQCQARKVSLQARRRRF